MKSRIILSILSVIAFTFVGCSSVHNYSGSTQTSATIQVAKQNWLIPKLTLKAINGKIVTSIVKNNYSPRKIPTGPTKVKVWHPVGNYIICEGTVAFQAEPGVTYTLTHNDDYQRLVFLVKKESSGDIVGSVLSTRVQQPRVMVIPQVIF